MGTSAMPTEDSSKQLQIAVASILEEDSRVTFAEYWNIGKELIEGLPIHSFYTRTGSGYVNLVVLAGKLVVDIETDEKDENPGILSVTAIESVARILFHAGPVQTIPESEKSLTLILSIVGGTDVGAYWVAETDEERQSLTRFGQSLMVAIGEH